MDHKYPVCIVGVGGRTPIGLTVVDSAAAVRAGISTIGEHPYMVDKGGEPMTVARDVSLPIDLPVNDRFSHLTLSALDEALFPITQVSLREFSPLLLIGLPHHRPGLKEDFHQELIQRLNLNNNVTFSLDKTVALPYGHSSGLMAMEEACRMIQSGHTEFCLAGGVDSYIEADTLEWLDTEEQLMSAENRSGFPPGEAACFCLLTSTKLACRLNLDIMGWIVAVATTQEENSIKTETVCIGKGLSDVITQVTSALKLPDEKINTIYCDMNGERYRTEEFAFTALRTQSAFVDVHDTVHPADCWGDVGAASGPLFTCIAISSGLRGYAKGPRALIWTSSEGGQRSAALLYLPMDE